MLTVDYKRLGVQAGDRVLDLGCGAGRHAYEAVRRGALVVAYDLDASEVKDTATVLAEPGRRWPRLGGKRRRPAPPLRRRRL